MDQNSKRLLNIFIIIICVCMVVIVTLLERREKEDNTEQASNESTVSPSSTGDQGEEESPQETIIAAGEPGYANLPSDYPVPTELIDEDEFYGVYFTMEDMETLSPIPDSIESMIHTKIDDYIEDFIFTDKQVGSNVGEKGLVSIVKDTFVLDEDNHTCKFNVDLNNDYILYITIDLQTGKFDIGNNLGIPEQKIGN